MTRLNTLMTACWLVLTSMFVLSCQDIADDDHYASPSWLKGNAWQVMEKEGNYSSFLQAIELTGYKPIVDGHTILTVMAPDNSAWQSFLKEQGYASVDEMFQKDPKTLKKTVGFHLMYYAYDWSKMVNFRPQEGDGATEESKSREAGMWYKHRTRSQDDMEEMRGKLNGVDTTVTVYHFERYLPVLSNKFFDTKGIDAKSNYEYFFPNSQWDVKGDGFQVANASVTDEKSVVTDNGYLYHVNQVVKPMETIYQNLRQNPNYSDYLTLYDTYAEFNQANEETNNNVGKVVYTLSHGELPNIACEWPVTDYRFMNLLESEGYNIFAPSNQAIDRFFTNYWQKEGGYKSLADLDPLILRYFIMQTFADVTEPVFPEEIRKEQVKTVYGTPININPDEVDDRVFCANGVFYGMNNMEAPAVFSSVVGPAFKDTTYQCYLYTLDKSDLILSLASNKSELVLLVPSNKQFNNNEPAIRLNSTVQGKNLEMFSEENGVFDNMGQTQALNIINMHTATNLNALKTEGVQVVKTNTPFNYWFIRNGQITTNALFNKQLEPSYTDSPFVDFHELTINGKSWDNGRTYVYDNKMLFSAQAGDGLAHLLALGNDYHYEYYLFAQLLQKAGLSSGGMLSGSVAPLNERMVVFVPTNEAIKEHIHEIPGCSNLTIGNNYAISGNLSSANKTLLAGYLRNYFITSLMNTITSYPYPGSSCKGVFMNAVGKNLEIRDNGSSLSVGFQGGQQVPVTNKYFSLPFAYSDGCMQLIDGILEQQ